MDDFSKLQPTRHMLLWLADEPETAIHAEVERMLCEQVPGSKLEFFVVASDPDWLTGARKQENDPDKAVLVRAAVAFEFALRVLTPQAQAHDLQGVLTWAAARLDRPDEAVSRLWFDIGGNLRQFGSEGELKARVYFDVD